MAAVYLGLGSNLGDRESSIRKALDILALNREIRVVRVSSMYETEPIGLTEQPDFINAAALIETSLSPTELLRVILDVEEQMGRVRNLRWGPRVIDIDILLYDNVAVDSPPLTIPHPRMLERAFVMAPLAEIAPDVILPDGRRPSEVLEGLKDQRVHRLGNG